jgi:hypothetical protein
MHTSPPNSPLTQAGPLGRNTRQDSHSPLHVTTLKALDAKATLTQHCVNRGTPTGAGSGLHSSEDLVLGAVLVARGVAPRERRRVVGGLHCWRLAHPRVRRVVPVRAALNPAWSFLLHQHHHPHPRQHLDARLPAGAYDGQTRVQTATMHSAVYGTTHSCNAALIYMHGARFSMGGLTSVRVPMMAP